VLLACVKGHLVATVKLAGFHGEKLLIVEPLDETGRPDGTEVVAVDRAGAGVGDIVLLLQEGQSCRMIMNKADVPAEALICGIVDRITLRQST
jgi:microcompartment protein CcmK/EutM